MIAREKLGKGRPGGRRLTVSAAMRLSDCLVRFLLAAVLSGAEILDGHALFALAFVAVCAPGLEGFGALLGAVLGYLSFRGFTAGLRYIAACMMVFAVSLALSEFKFYRRRWFMPAICALINALVGFVYQAALGWDIAAVVGLLTEIVLTAAAVYFYRLALETAQQTRPLSGLPVKQIVGILVLGVTVMLTLARVTVADRYSLGRVLCVLAVILAGWKGGVGVGAAAGVAAGLAMDLSAGSIPYYTMTYGVSGLITGIFSNQKRFLCALAYIMSSGAAMLWTGTADFGGHIYEVAAGGVIFLILPDKLLRRLSSLVLQERLEQDDSAIRSVRRRLQQMAEAFRSVSGSLEEAFPAPIVNDADSVRIFDRAAERVCVKCKQRERCWQREYQATRTAMADALGPMMDRGEGRRGDFPAYFSGRCGQMDAFLRAANRELTALLYRRSYDSRVRESRRAVCAQYGHMARMLERRAEELAREPVTDGNKQRQLKQRMTALGVEGRCCVWQDEFGHSRIEMEGQGVEIFAKEAEVAGLSALMGCPLRVDSSEKGFIKLSQKEPLMAVAAVAAAQRDGQKISGDTGAWFKDESGRLYVILCDGMGSGGEAKEDSSCALSLLEKFLRAGMEVEEALSTVGDALALRGEEKGGFTTVDLLQFDLYTGEGKIYKQGAAPTYLRHGNQVDRLAGSSLPAGVAARDGQPDCFPVKLSAGDWVVMISDGVASQRDDGWLKQMIGEFSESSPRMLADAVLVESGLRQGREDDRTIMVLKVDTRA